MEWQERPLVLAPPTRASPWHRWLQGLRRRTCLLACNCGCSHLWDLLACTSPSEFAAIACVRLQFGKERRRCVIRQDTCGHDVRVACTKTPDLGDSGTLLLIRRIAALEERNEPRMEKRLSWTYALDQRALLTYGTSIYGLQEVRFACISFASPYFLEFGGPQIP